MKLNIDSRAVIAHTNRLRKMHKSALPIAIRSTLNDVAYQAKTVTILSEVKKTFIEREKNFFKVATKFEKATGFNISTMIATVGFVDSYLKGSNNYAAKDLEPQEKSGKISGRSFIALKQSRYGNSFNKAVRASNRITKLQSIVNAKNANGVSPGQRFAKSVAFAGKGGFVISEGNQKGQRFIFRVNSLRRTSEGKFKLTPLYVYKKNRKVNVKATRFMEKAYLKAADKIEAYYIKNVEKQILRLK